MRLTAKHFLYGGFVAFAFFMYRDLSLGNAPTQLVDLGSSNDIDDAGKLYKEVLSEDSANQFLQEILETTSSATAPKDVKLDLGFRRATVLAIQQDGSEFLANVHVSSDRKNLQITDLPQKQPEVKELNDYLAYIMRRVAQDAKDKTLKRIEMIEDSLILYYSLDDAQQ